MDRLTTRNKFGQAEIGFYDMETKGIEKLAYYEDLEEQGRLLKLPCAVGTPVYIIDDIDCDKCIHYLDNCMKYDSIKCPLDVFECKFPLRFIDEEYELGEDYFLTREEAEAKLKEMER